VAEPFFDLPACPDAAGLAVPAAIPPGPLLADCEVPEAPPPAFACPPIRIPTPPTIGSTLLHVRIVGRSGLAHDWAAVEADGEGGWRLDGRSGSDAYEQWGAKVRPGPRVYLARRIPGLGRLVFHAPRVPFFVKLSGAGPAYDWAAVTRSGAGAWAATGESGTAAGGDGAVEANDADLDEAVASDPDAVYSAQRTEEGSLVVDASTSSAGGGGPGGVDPGDFEAATAPYWCRSPDEGVDAASGPMSSRTPTAFVADVYASTGGAMTLAAAGATVYWWAPAPCGGGKLVPLRPAGGGAFEALNESCNVVPPEETP